VGVDNGCQVDLACLDSVLQNRCNPIEHESASSWKIIEDWFYVLWGVCGINDDGILGLIVNYQICVVVGAPLPCGSQFWYPTQYPFFPVMQRE
jgi:hypothetical protein